MDAIEKLRKLQPTENTITYAVEAEEVTANKMKTMLKNGDIDIKTINILIKVLTSINKIRTNQRGEISITSRIIRDISNNPDEFKMYVEATFPKAFKKE